MEQISKMWVVRDAPLKCNFVIELSINGRFKKIVFVNVCAAVDRDYMVVVRISNL